jgi:hypothetical protein
MQDKITSYWLLMTGLINVAKFQRLATTITNRKYIQEEIKEDACYHSVLHLSSSRFLSLSKEHFEIKICKTIILPFVYGCKTHTKGITQTEGVWEQGAEENIWT